MPVGSEQTGVSAALKRLVPQFASTDDRVFHRDFLIFGTIIFVLTAAVYIATTSWRLPFPQDNTTLALGRDFLNFWMYGRAAGTPDPGRFYDVATYNAELRAVLGPGFPGQNWSYPPSVMLLAAPFAQFGYLTALAVWTVLGLVLFLSVARSHVDDWRILLPVALSPAALFCLISGQSSFITAAMLLTIFAWLDRRPVLAGVLIGLLTLKPQVGFLFPFMLIAAGRWRVFASATATTLLLVGLTGVAFGFQIWVDFVAKGLPAQNLVLSDPHRIATPFYPTVFMNVRGLDLDYAVAMTAQLLVSVPAILATIWAFRYRRDADPRLLRALFLSCSVAASPYLLAYDTLALTFAAVTLLSAGLLNGAGRRLVQLVFWIPTLQLVFGSAHLPGPALIAPAFAAWLVLRLKAEPMPQGVLHSLDRFSFGNACRDSRP
jgi:hypothetical protein